MFAVDKVIIMQDDTSSRPFFFFKKKSLYPMYLSLYVNVLNCSYGSVGNGVMCKYEKAR